MKLNLGQLDEDLTPVDRPLRIDLVLEKLDEEEKAHLLVVLNSDEVPAERLSKALAKQHIHASAKTIVKWRERNDAQ